MMIYVLVQLSNFQTVTASFLDNAGKQIDTLVQNDLTYPIHIERTIPLAMDVPINQEITLPVKFQFETTFPLDTQIPVDTQVKVPIVATIPVDQTFNVSVLLLGQNVNLPVAIQGQMPVDIEVNIPIKQNVPVKADIPLVVPVDSKFTFNIVQTIPIKSDVPVNLEIPVTISLKDSPLSDLGKQLTITASQLSSGPSIYVFLLIFFLFLIIGITVIYLIFRRKSHSFDGDAGNTPQSYEDDFFLETPHNPKK
jgi:hypothetical protein